MANDYFDSGDYTPLTAHTLARAGSVNGIFGALVTAFDRLPPKLALDQDRVTYATEHVTSAANVYVLNLPQPLVAYTEGLTVKFKTAHVNTGGTTVNIDGLGAKTVLRGDGTALQADDIPAGAFMMMGYDGTNFKILSGAGSLSDLTAHTSATAVHGATGAVVGTTNAQTLTNKTLSAAILTGATTLPGSGQIDSSGHIGIGQTPTEAIDILKSTNTQTYVKVRTNNAGNATLAGFRARADEAAELVLNIYGSGFSSSGAAKASGVLLQSAASAGIHYSSLVTGGKHVWYVDGTEMARLNATGLIVQNGGVDISGGASVALDVRAQSSVSRNINLIQSSTGDAAIGLQISGVTDWTIGVDNSDSDRLKIARSSDLNSSAIVVVSEENDGAMIVGSTGAGLGTNKFLAVQADGSEDTAFLVNAAGTPGTALILQARFSGAAPDNNTAKFLSCTDSTTERMRVYSDGDVQNHDNSFTAISDENLKQDVKDYDAAGQWEDYKAIRLRKYRFISDVETKGDAEAKEQLGVIAQELAAIMPGLVRDYPDTEEVELEPERVEIRKVTRPRYETVTVDAEELTEVDGQMVLVIVQREARREVMQTLPVVDNRGRPVMEEVQAAQPQVRDPRTGEVVLPALPAIMRQRTVTRPVMEEVDEEVTVPAKRGRRLTGTSTKGVLYSVLNLKTIAIVQELMRRVEALEAKVGT